MATLQIATVGKSAGDLLATLPESPFSRLLLIHEEENAEAAKAVADVVASLSRKVALHAIPSLGVPEAVAEILSIIAREAVDFDGIVVNVASAEPPLCCAASYAGLLACVPVVGARAGELLAFPPLVTPYWRFLSGPKERLLRILFDAGGRATVKDLASATRMSRGTVHYHMRDARSQRGLADLGLVRRVRERGAPAFELAPAGLVAVLGGETERRAGPTRRLTAATAEVARTVLP